MLEGEEAGLKPVAAAWTTRPCWMSAGCSLAAFVRERYFCTFYDAIKAMLPAGIWFRERNRYAIVPDADWKTAISRRPDALAVMQTLEAWAAARRKRRCAGSLTRKRWTTRFAIFCEKSSLPAIRRIPPCVG